MKIFFDGGCRPNPGPMETAVVAGGRTYYRDDHGEGDNSDAEWLALIEALYVARSLGVEEAILLGDSAMVVERVSSDGHIVAPRFRLHLAQVRELAQNFSRLRVRRIRRGLNLAGIALERVHGRL